MLKTIFYWSKSRHLITKYLKNLDWEVLWISSLVSIFYAFFHFSRALTSLSFSFETVALIFLSSIRIQEEFIYCKSVCINALWKQNTLLVVLDWLKYSIIYLPYYYYDLVPNCFCRLYFLYQRKKNIALFRHLNETSRAVVLNQGAAAH